MYIPTIFSGARQWAAEIAGVADVRTANSESREIIVGFRGGPFSQLRLLHSIKEYGGEDQESSQDILRVGGHIQKGHAVDYHSNQHDAYKRAPDRADAAG